MPLYDEGLSRAKEWVNNYMMNNLAPNMATGGMMPPTMDMGPMGAPNLSMNLPSAPAPQAPTGGTPAKGGKSTTEASVKPAPVPIPPRPQDIVAMRQIASVPDYVAKFLIDLSRKMLDLPEGGMPTPTPNPAMGLPSGPQQTQPYLVGEGGPELFTPQTPGQITPISRQFGTPEGEVDTPTGPKPAKYGPGWKIPETSILGRNIPNINQLGETAIGVGEYLGRLPMYLGAKGREVAESALGIEPISPRPSYMTSTGQQQRMEELLPGGPQLPTPTLSTFGYKTTPTVDMVLNPITGTYETKPTRYGETILPGGEATPYSGPVPWKNIPSSPTITPTLPSPEGLAKWGITKDILPTGETRYTLPGTEGTMTLPSGWDATAEGQKVFGAMRPGYYSDIGERMEPPTVAPRSYYETHPEERVMDIEALGTAPPRGMAEYEATIARGKMTRRERREAGVADRELRKQALINRGALDVAQLQYGPTSPESQQHLAYTEHLRGLTPANLQMERERSAAHLQGVRETIAGHLKVAGITADQKDPIYKGAYNLLNTMARQAGQGFPTDVNAELSNFFKMAVSIGDMTPEQYAKLPPEYKQKMSRQQAVQFLKDNKLPETERNIQYALTGVK